MYHQRKEPEREGEWEKDGVTCVPAAEGGKKEGGRVPGIPERQVTNTQTAKGGNETDRWSGVERWRYNTHTSLQPVGYRQLVPLRIGFILILKDVFKLVENLGLKAS